MSSIQEAGEGGYEPQRVVCVLRGSRGQGTPCHRARGARAEYGVGEAEGVFGDQDTDLYGVTATTG